MTTTIEPQTPQPNATDPQATVSCSDIDPDTVIIESTGGPIDGGGGSHSGSNPPPES